MSRHAKPEFRQGGTFLTDADFLPEPLARDLRFILLRARLSDDLVQTFLSRCGQEAQFFCEARATMPAAKIVEKLDRVAGEARRLLAALNSLGPEASSTFLAHWDYLAFGSAPPVRLTPESAAKRGEEGRFLGAAWDIVSDLEVSATYAASMCNPTRGAKIGEAGIRVLVRKVADIFEAVAGRRPPYSKGTWFPEFMQTLAGWEGIGVPCGGALVEAALRTKEGQGEGAKARRRRA